MTELWWCITCQRNRHFATFDANGFSWILCQACGNGTCVTPEPIKEEDVA